MIKEKMSPLDYEKLKVFLGKFIDWYWLTSGMPPEVHPLFVLSATEKASLANAKSGLQTALNDIVEDTANWSPEAVAHADARFAAAGTFTLTVIRRRYSKKYLQILKRGEIRSEADYYLLKGILDGGGIEPGATEAAQIQKMLDEFEVKIMQKAAK